jgi:hypothetical protein
MVSTRNPRMWSMARKHMWCEMYEPLVNDLWPHNPHFCRKYHERPFSIILKANTPMDFSPRNGLYQNSKNVIYGKETYAGSGVRAFGWWSKATQSLFLSKIAWTTIFNNAEGQNLRIFYQEMVSTRNPRMWSMARKHMWGQVNEPLVNDQWPHNPHFCRK